MGNAFPDCGKLPILVRYAAKNVDGNAPGQTLRDASLRLWPLCESLRSTKLRQGLIVFLALRCTCDHPPKLRQGFGEKARAEAKMDS